VTELGPLVRKRKDIEELAFPPSKNELRRAKRGGQGRQGVEQALSIARGRGAILYREAGQDQRVVKREVRCSALAL
jgi:hypothetical protein